MSSKQKRLLSIIRSVLLLVVTFHVCQAGFLNGRYSTKNRLQRRSTPSQSQDFQYSSCVCEKPTCHW